ncbi:hypothetical protein KsCSTR_05120 [Candidatus Kuenenia stuttgartiensis]|uniref:Uncharacterized protein n=1 Tax=Kuenenia stuttgartiensis TaxID=174633 RepID=Q1Q075_KUEST|nr:hypothetical protein KsCSTR_05120 [Candidatus Kuenenia stuttgartiensis]CAJ72730.1 unknown protein [Candidatus Kuenenia stuttgartiensis]
MHVQEYICRIIFLFFKSFFHMVTISCKILYQEIRNHIFCLISKIILFLKGTRDYAQRH